MRCLVTAGGTRERIDRVRDWGNVFTGNTGYAIARELATLGPVDLVTSNRDHLRELASPASNLPIFAVPFTSHEELRSALAALMAVQKYAAVFMTAAVSDYVPDGVYKIVSRTVDTAAGTEAWVVKNVQAGKVKSTFDELAVTGKRTQKIVDLFRAEWGYTGLLVKFKLEVGIEREKLIRIGQASRFASGADYLVANTLGMVEGEGAGAYLLSEHEPEWVPRAELARRLRALVAMGACDHRITGSEG